MITVFRATIYREILHGKFRRCHFIVCLFSEKVDILRFFSNCNREESKT